AYRADSFQQLLLPQTFFGWLNLTPRAGGRFTDYGETDGLNATNKEQQRWLFNTGAEVSFKASRIWNGARSRHFDLDGLRHIIERSRMFIRTWISSRVPGSRSIPRHGSASTAGSGAKRTTRSRCRPTARGAGPSATGICGATRRWGRTPETIPS